MTLHTFIVDTYVVENVYSTQWKHRSAVHDSLETGRALRQGSTIEGTPVDDYQTDVEIPGAPYVVQRSQAGMG
jgi:hypothetical protein